MSRADEVLIPELPETPLPVEEPAQENVLEPPVDPESTPPEEKDPRAQKFAALERLVQRKADLQTKIDAKKSALREAETDYDREQLRADLSALQEELNAAKNEFARVSIGFDLEAVDSDEGLKLDLKDELKQLLSPAIQELREVTAAPRETEELKGQIARLEAHLSVVEKAQAEINSLLARETNSETLTEALQEERTELQDLRQNLETELSVARYQLDDREKSSPSLFEGLSNMVQNFFRTRGAHLLIAFLVSGLVVFLIRQLYRGLMRVSPKKVRNGRNFAGRLSLLIYHVLSVLGGIIGFLITLYIANDWVLLSLTVLLLAGIIWTGKNMFGSFLEQAKLMLNLGTVRHGERLNYEGISWRVGRINFYTQLTNPELEGGLIRLPLAVLMELHSRPTTPKELWFPCQEGDWVELTDGTYGKVLQQTPDYVHLVKLGGSRRVIPTPDFMGLHPENLSKNYRIVVVFGIDYAYQDICTEKVPLVFKSILQKRMLEKLEDKALLLNLNVFFHSASASSLDYRIVVDLDGSLAPRKGPLQDFIQSVCVDVCNAHDWSIPFTQITIHQADSTDSAVEEAPAPRLP